MYTYLYNFQALKIYLINFLANSQRDKKNFWGEL